MKKEQKIDNYKKYVKDIEKILLKFFVKDYVSFDKERKVIWFPLGCISFTDTSIAYCLDYHSISPNAEHSLNYQSIVNNTLNQVVLINLARKISELKVDYGYFTVFNNDKVFVGLLFNDVIKEYTEKNKDVEFSIARTLLEQKMILEFEEIKEKNDNSRKN